MILLAGVSMLLYSCGGESATTPSENSETTITNAENLDCQLLEKFSDDYSKLLTKEDISSVYSIDFSIAKEDKRSGNYGEYIFSWPSDRPEFIVESSGFELKVPDKNTIGIKTFSYSKKDTDMKAMIERIDMAYKELSEDELTQMDENLSKQDEEIKSTGEDMMKIRGNRSWEFISDLGSSSWFKWNEQYGGELAVLAGKAKFYIIIKISDNPEENRDLAKKLAEKVIAKC